MAPRQEIGPGSTTVQAVVDRFLQWNENHRSQGTYEWYTGHLGPFGEYHVGASSHRTKLSLRRSA
jgi:hypothetical protein